MSRMRSVAPQLAVVPDLLAELRLLIDEARRSVALAVNAGLTLTYWRIGERINTEVLGGERAAYGEEIVSTLSRQLTAEYASGFAQAGALTLAQSRLEPGRRPTSEEQ